jgi:hypothetical protein
MHSLKIHEYIHRKGLLILAMFRRFKIVSDELGAFAFGTEVMGKQYRQVEEEILTHDHEV